MTRDMFAGRKRYYRGRWYVRYGSRFVWSAPAYVSPATGRWPRVGMRGQAVPA